LAKKVARKTAKKAKTAKKKANNVLKKAPAHATFVMIDGKKIHTLPQLALEMDNMAEDIFSHHVNEARNDFANWIRDVIGEIELADRLMGVRSKDDTQLQILKHIVKSLR